eukprot:Sspe_Gene.55304::Locus_30423_Transcript_1_1_Confidence_1.000_Length_452::g.55304::m.55304
MQKQTVLDAADVCTSAKEAYYNTKLALEEMRASRWNFAEEATLFQHLDSLYDRTTELLGCLDALSQHHEAHTQMKKAGRVAAPMVGIRLFEIRSELNELDFDFTAEKEVKRWHAVLGSFRSQIADLQELEEADESTAKKLLAAPAAPPAA